MDVHWKQKCNSPSGGPKLLQLGLARLGLGLALELGLRLGLVSVIQTGVKLSALPIYNTLESTR